MSGDPALLSAINRLYAAALAREDWPSALASIRDAFAGHHIVLGAHDFESGQRPFIATAGIDPVDHARLLSDEANQMAYPYFAATPVDVAIPRGALVRDSEFARSAFYNEFLRPAQGFHSVGATLRGPGPLTTIVHVCRPERAGEYDAPDAAAFQVLVPHLLMALEVRHRLNAADSRSDGLERLLDQVSVATFVTDGSARPRFMNARARALIAGGDGLMQNAAGLAAATPALTRDLRAAIAGIAAGNGNGAGPAAGLRLRLARPSQRPPLRATLMPAWRLDPDGAGGNGASAHGVAILVAEPDAPPPIDKEALADTFRLTAREAEIAVLLAGGADPARIAATLDLGIGTVRNHLKRVFQKTGVASQAALVALARGFTRLDVP
jgi:DNA-binding CsgD family transcriptional regulator